METKNQGKEKEKINIKFEYKKLKKNLTSIPKSFYNLRDDFLYLYENDYNFKFDNREIPMDDEGFNKVFNYIKKQKNPVIVVEKENIISGEVDDSEEEEENKEGNISDIYEEVEEEEAPKGNWTVLLGVKGLTSEEKFKVSKKGRKEIEEENKLRDNYEKMKKDINFVEKQKLEEMTYKSAVIILYTKIIPAEELIVEIKEKDLFNKNEVINFGKKILMFKKNYENIINKKEAEHSELVAFKINQQEIGKQNEEQASEIKKKYEELQEAYKDIWEKLREDADSIKKELESQTKLNNKLNELTQENEQLNKELEEERNLNQQLLDMNKRLEPMEDDMKRLREKINKINSISINYNEEKEQLMRNLEQLSNLESKKLEELSQQNTSKDDMIKKLNNDISNLMQNKGISVNTSSNEDLKRTYENLLKEKEEQLKEKQKRIIKNLNEIYKQNTKLILDKYKQITNEQIKKTKEEILKSQK